ncbi:MAG TPA: molybdenum cofactor guanylyltransferase [Nitrospiraceae bacterium]|nr:molybdenum cofactor guanylyltransferase [Nitrospiraceae bacterium]
MAGRKGMISEVTGVLLAGGKSRRMGEDKRYLLVGERTLLERSLEILQTVFQHVVIVIAQDSAPLEQVASPVIRDLIPDCGSLGGLYTGLKQASTDHVFVVGCDMPFLNPVVIRHFVNLKTQADIVMAKLSNGLHPMHAVYGKPCLPSLEQMIAARNLKIQDLASQPALRVRLVTAADLVAIDPTARSFHNVNTPADLEAARSFTQQPGQPRFRS